jgi:DnaJ-class molecular chaperone
MGKHENPQACGACGGKGFTEINLDSRIQKITCGSCNGTGKA